MQLGHMAFSCIHGGALSLPLDIRMGLKSCFGLFCWNVNRGATRRLRFINGGATINMGATYKSINKWPEVNDKQ